MIPHVDIINLKYRAGESGDRADFGTHELDGHMDRSEIDLINADMIWRVARKLKPQTIVIAAV